MTNSLTQKHSAPGPMAGYSFEFYRALYWLSEATSETIVAIETDDDVSIVEKDGTYIFEQDKHSIAQGNANPIADTSKALWNTLKIWLQLIEQGVQPENSRFLMVTNRQVPKDSLIGKIGLAENEEASSACVARMRAMSNLPNGIQAIADEVLARDDNILKRLFARVKLIDQTGEDGNVALQVEIIGNLRIPSSIKEHSNEIFDEMLGWVQQAAMRAWNQKRPATIGGQAFINALDSAKGSRLRVKKLERSAHLIDVPGDEKAKHRGNTFVKQMMLITSDQGEIDDAINDFIRASTELLRLSDEGELIPTDLKTLEYDMVDRWKPIRRRNMRLHRDREDEEIGYIIFDETTGDYLLKIKGIPTEHFYFTRGAYHRLSERLSVGWHPHFEEILNKQ